MPSKKVTKKAGKGKAAPAKQAPAAPKENPLFPARPKNFRIGGDIRHKADLSRYVKWPRYVRIQRQRKILLQRLKVPPALNQFRRTLDKAQAKTVFDLFAKYSPETKAEKRVRLLNQAQDKVAGGSGTSAAPKTVKFGINHVTTLIEAKKAKLVLIAHDVDPIELVVWLPALCRKMDVPFAIVKGKARLGQLIHQKKATAVCLTDVNNEDKAALTKLSEMCHDAFNKNVERYWGGGIMGLKTQAKLEKRRKALQAELNKKVVL